MSTAVKTMKSFMDVLKRYSYDTTTSGVTVLSNAVRAVSFYSDLETAISYFVYEVTSTEVYSNTYERLYETCGIVLGDEEDFTADTGAVSGYNAGGDTVKDAQSIVPEPEAMTLQDISAPAAGTTTTHTFTGDDGKVSTFYVKWADDFNIVYDYANAKEDEQGYIDEDTVEELNIADYDGSFTVATAAQVRAAIPLLAAGLDNWWLPESFKLAYDSYGLDFNGKTITINFAVNAPFQAETGTLDEEAETVPNDELAMKLNADLYGVIDSEDQNGNTRVTGGEYQNYLDRTIAHEMIHATMFGDGILKEDMPEFFTEGVAELVMGLDDYDSNNTEDIYSLADSYSLLSGAMSLEAGTGHGFSYVAGYMFLRWLCHESLDTEIIFGTDESDVINYYGDNVVVNDFNADDFVIFNSDIKGLYFYNDDFTILSETGGMILRDVADITVNFIDDSGTLKAQAYSNSEESYSIKIFDSSESFTFNEKTFQLENATATFNLQDGEVESITDLAGRISGLDSGTYLVNGIELEVGESDKIVGTGSSAYVEHAADESFASQIAVAALQKTEGGTAVYELVANPIFKPHDPPENYFSSETWVIKSDDNLTLKAAHFSPQNPTGKWVVLIHGYGNDSRYLYGYVGDYLDKGYDVLTPDMRAAGQSEGEWLTMGTAESRDVVKWTQEIAATNRNAQITLHGVSMGAATVVMTAAREDCTNVTGIIVDSGYTNAFGAFVNGAASVGVGESVMQMVDVAAKNITGYAPSEASPLDDIPNVTEPTLFIVGDADTLTPASMTDELYGASGAEVKEKIVFEGAGHAESVIYHYDEYKDAVMNFIEETNEDIGADISNTAEDYLVRGTIFDDTIENFAVNATISGGAGNDTVSNSADSVTIIADAGFDDISNTGDAVSVLLNDSVIKLNDQYFKGNGTITMTNGAVEIEGDVIVLDTITISSGNSEIYGGVEYTAIGGDAVLSIDSETSTVVGIESGVVTAEIADASSTPTITLDGSTAFEFTATTTSADALKIGYRGMSIDYTSGAVTYDSNGISVGEGEVGISLLSGLVGFTLDVPESGMTATLIDGVATLIAEDKVAVDVTGLIEGGLSLQGEVTYNMDDRTLSVAKDTALGVDIANLLGNEMNLSLDFAVTDAAGGTFTLDIANGITYTPNSEDGSLDFNVSTSGASLGGNLEITGGTFSVGIDGTVSLSENATFKLTTDDSSVLITTGDDPLTINVPLTGSGEITISPSTFTVELEDGSGREIFSGDVSISGGDLTYDTSSDILALESGTTISATTANGNTFAATASGDASVGLEFVDGAIKISGQENDATLDVSFTTSDSVVVDANLDIGEGSGISFTPSTGEYEIESGTKITVTDFGGEHSYNIEVETPSGVSGQLTRNEAGQLQVIVEGGLDVLTDTSVIPSTDPVYEEGTYLLLKVEDASTGEARTLFDGGINVVAGTVAFTPQTGELSLESGTLVAGFIDGLPYDVRIVATDDATAKFALDGTKISVMPEDDEGNLLFIFGAQGGSSTPAYIAPAVLSAKGTISYDISTSEFSLVEGSSINLETFNIDDDSANGFFFQVTAVDGDSNATIDLDETTGKVTITPDTSDGALELSVGRDDVTFLSGTARTSAGSYSVTPNEDGSMNLSVSEDAEIVFENSTVSRIVSVEDGLSFDVILDSSTGLVTATAAQDEVINLEVYSFTGLKIGESSFTIGKGSSVTAGRTSDTTLLNLGGNSNVSFTRSDITIKMSTDEDAGVGISVNEDGNIVVVPGEDDGGLSFEVLSGTDTLLSNTVSVSGGSIILGDEGVSLESGTAITVDSVLYSSTFTVSNDAGVNVGFEDGAVAITPNDGDGKLVISATILGFEIPVGELEISGGSILINPFEGYAGLTKGATATLNIADSYEITATATGDATLNFELDGTTLILTPEEDDGSLDLSLTSGGETVFSGNVEVSGGSVKYDILGGAYEIESGTTLNVTDAEAFGGTYNVKMYAATDLAGVIGFADGSPQITIKGDTEFDPDSQPDSSTAPERTYLSLTVDNGTQTIFDGDIDVMGGEVTLSRDKISLAENTKIALSTEDSPYSISVMNMTETDFGIGISDGVIQLSFDDSDTGIVLGVEPEGKPESGFSGELKGVGTVTYDPATNEFLLLKGSEITVSTRGQEYATKLTATDDAGGIFSLGEDGVISFTPGSSDGDLKIDLVDESGTSVAGGTISMLSGTVSYTPVNEEGVSNISFSEGTDILVEGDLGRVLEVIAEEGGSFDFTVDSETGMVKLEPTDDAVLDVKYTSIVTGETYEGTVKLSGAIGFEGSDRELFMASGTTIEVTYGEYEVSITATEDASATVEISDDGTIYINNGEDDGALFVTLGYGGKTFFSSTLNLNGGVSFNPSTHETGLIAGSTAEFSISGYTLELTAPEDASVIFSREDTVFTLSTNDTEKAATFTVYDSTGEKVFGGTASLKGSISFDVLTRAVALSDGTTIGLSVENYGMEVTANGDASTSLVLDGSKFVMTPGENDGSLDITLTSGEETIFDGEISVESGSISFDRTTGELEFAAGTSVAITVGDYTFITSNEEAAGGIVTFSEGGVTYTPNTDDGDLAITVKLGDTSVELGTLSVTNGSFTLDAQNNITVSSGTSMTVAFSDDYSVTFTATDEAGGKVTLVEGGLTFAPNSEDGGLELSVTRGTETRTTTLDVTGEVTYVLGGSIELAEGTVVKNTFESGRTLTITANTAAAGVIRNVTTGKGLTIIPADKDSLTVEVDMGDGDNKFVFNEIEGSIIYKGGNVTLADGTSLVGVLENSLGEVDYSIGTEGGESTIDFEDDEIIFEPDDGATLTVSVNEDNGYIITEGSIKVVSQEDSTPEFIFSEGSVISANIGFAVTLETAGTYTLNGAEITTTEDGVEVYMTDYDTVSFPADAAVDLGGVTFSGEDATVTITDGNIVLSDGIEVSNAGDTEFVMYESGTAVIDGKTFVLTEDVEEGVTVSSAESGLNVITADELGPFTETVSVTNDESYTITADSLGVDKVLGVSGGAVVDGIATYNGGVDITFFDIVTDSEGEFTFGDNAYTVAGDDNVSFTTEFGVEGATLEAVKELDGTVSGAFENSVEINGGFVKIIGDDSINIVGEDSAVVEISGVSDGATVVSAGGAEKVITDSEGEFVFDGGATYNVEWDDSVIFELDTNGAVTNVADLDGELVSSSTKNTVNGVAIEVSDNSAVIGAYIGDDEIAVRGLPDGATVKGDTENIAVILENSTVTISKTTYNYTSYDGEMDDVVIKGNEISDLEKNDSLQTSQGGTYTVNGTELVAKPKDIFVGIEDEGEDRGAYIYDPKTSPINGNSSTADILEKLGATEDYGEPTTETDLVVNAEDGDAAMVLENTDRREQVADFSETEGKKSVTLGGGDQAVSFNDENQNVAVVPTAATGTKNIELGDGKDVVVVEDTAAEVNITTGDGKYQDTVVTKGADVTVDFGGDSNARVDALAGSVTLENYNPDTKAGLQANTTDVANSIAEGEITFGDGAVYIENATVQAGEDVPIGETMVNIYNNNGKKRKVGFTHSEGGNLDASDETERLVLVGNQNGDKTGGSTLKGGSNNDTIFAGAGDVIDAGDGKNVVELGESRTAGTEGALILMDSEKGQTTVNNFLFDFGEYNSDAVAADVKTADIKFDGTNVTIYEDDEKIFLPNAKVYTAASDSESDTGFGEVSYTKLLLGEEGDVKTAVAKKGAVIAVADSETTTPEAYIGEDSGVDFSGYNRKLNINLGEESGTVDKLDAVFRGINRVKAGSAEATLIGSEENDTLVAGSGMNILDGGDGNDSLVGYTGEGKTDYTTFVFTDGHDTIEGFEATTGENKYTADKINLGENIIENIAVDLNGNLLIELEGSTNTDVKVLQVNGMAGKDVAIYNEDEGDFVMQAGRKELTVDGVADYYFAANSNATVNIASSLGSAEVWLADEDRSGGVAFDGEINVLNGSGVSGATTLVGNDYDNVIIASSGNSSLWGSFNGNDTLIGGDGEELFWYEFGNGKDKVVGATENDVVYLNCITLDMFANSTEATDSSLKLNFEDGGSLSLDTNNGTTFKTADGASYVYNKTDGKWDEK